MWGTFISPLPYTCSWLIRIPFPAVVCLLFAYFRPYKNNLFNIIDCLGFAALALGMYLIVYAMETKAFPIQFLYVLMLLPLLYFTSFILYKILSRVQLFRTCCSQIGERLQARNENHHLHIPRGDEDLPDRIVNPHMYQPLLSTMKNGEGNSQIDSQQQAGVNSLVAYGSM